MTVCELIERLQELPPDMEVRAWDADEDDFVPVQDVLFEEGHTSVDLLTVEG